MTFQSTCKGERTIHFGSPQVFTTLMSQYHGLATNGSILYWAKTRVVLTQKTNVEIQASSVDTFSSAPVRREDTANLISFGTSRAAQCRAADHLGSPRPITHEASWRERYGKRRRTMPRAFPIHSPEASAKPTPGVYMKT
jgi:hypothetical protein